MKPGSVIRLLRRMLGRTQVELAESAGVNYRHYQTIEEGRADLKTSTAARIASNLKVPTCYLFQPLENNPTLPLGVGCTIELLDHLCVGILVHDTQGNVIYLNRFFRDNFLPFKPEDVPGKKIWDFLYDEKERERAEEAMKFYVSTKPEPTYIYFNNRGPAGEKIPMLIRWNYLYDPKGNISGMISAILKCDGNAIPFPANQPIQ